MDEVLVEEVVQAASAFDDFEDRNESDLEEDEDEDGENELNSREKNFFR